MNFKPHTQEELKTLNIVAGQTYTIEYANKDYYNGDDTIELGKAVALLNGNNIYFNVTDPYGMDKMILKARVIL